MKSIPMFLRCKCIYRGQKKSIIRSHGYSNTRIQKDEYIFILYMYTKYCINWSNATESKKKNIKANNTWKICTHVRAPNVKIWSLGMKNNQLNRRWLVERDFWFLLCSFWSNKRNDFFGRFYFLLHLYGISFVMCKFFFSSSLQFYP